MAASNPELVAELLREAEFVVREAPPAVRGDMAQVVNLLLLHPPIKWSSFNIFKVGAPVGPQEGSIYSTFASLGTRHSLFLPRVTQCYNTHPQA